MCILSLIMGQNLIKAKGAIMARKDVKRKLALFVLSLLIFCPMVSVSAVHNQASGKAGGLIVNRSKRY